MMLSAVTNKPVTLGMFQTVIEHSTTFPGLLSVLAVLCKCSLILLMFFRSVAACEAVVKKQYALLGWEYRDTDSDDDYNVTVCGKMQIIDSVKNCAPSMALSFGNCSVMLF